MDLFNNLFTVICAILDTGAKDRNTVNPTFDDRHL